MEIDSELFIKILHVNFKFEIVDTDLGKGLKVDPFTAFIYSCVTGAGYLDNPAYPFTPKGIMKVFYSALDYRFVTGIFDNTSLKNTPLNLHKAKKFLFNSDKIIVPVEFDSERELQKILSDFISKQKQPTENFVIQRIEKSKNGNGMEPFLEYLACETIRRDNFIVESQVPLSHSKGSPDFAGYRFNSVSVPFNSVHIFELALIRLGLSRSCVHTSLSNRFIVGEAKTSTTDMKNQLEKYLSTNFFNEAYEIHSSKISPAETVFGLITLDKKYRVVLTPPREKDTFVLPEKQSKYRDWLENYIKYYLIANLTNDEFVTFYQEKNKRKISSSHDVVTFINSLSYEDILTKITEVSYGSV